MKQEDINPLVELSVLIDGLGENTEYEETKRMAGKLSQFFNCFGSYSKKTADLYASLTDAGKSNYDLIALISMFSLAYEYEEHGLDCWDERKKASEIFSYKNKEFIQGRFNEVAGFPITYDKGEGFLHRALNRKPFRDNGKAWVVDYLGFWNSEHSTLKQSFINGYVNGVLLPSYGEDKFSPNSDYGISFPFI